MPNSIIDQLKWRYACKAFDSDRFLNETQIQLLKEAFNLTASSYGLQPLKLLVISNKELKKKSRECFDESKADRAMLPSTGALF